MTSLGPVLVSPSSPACSIAGSELGYLASDMPLDLSLPHKRHRPSVINEFDPQIRMQIDNDAPMPHRVTNYNRTAYSACTSKTAFLPGPTIGRSVKPVQIDHNGRFEHFLSTPFVDDGPKHTLNVRDSTYVSVQDEPTRCLAYRPANTEQRLRSSLDVGCTKAMQSEATHAAHAAVQTAMARQARLKGLSLPDVPSFSYPNHTLHHSPTKESSTNPATPIVPHPHLPVTYDAINSRSAPNIPNTGYQNTSVEFRFEPTMGYPIVDEEMFAPLPANRRDTQSVPRPHSGFEHLVNPRDVNGCCSANSQLPPHCVGVDHGLTDQFYLPSYCNSEDVGPSLLTTKTQSRDILHSDYSDGNDNSVSFSRHIKEQHAVYGEVLRKRRRRRNKSLPGSGASHKKKCEKGGGSSDQSFIVALATKEAAWSYTNSGKSGSPSEVRQRHAVPESEVTSAGYWGSVEAPACFMTTPTPYITPEPRKPCETFHANTIKMNLHLMDIEEWHTGPSDMLTPGEVNEGAHPYFASSQEAPEYLMSRSMLGSVYNELPKCQDCLIAGKMCFTCTLLSNLSEKYIPVTNPSHRSEATSNIKIASVNSAGCNSHATMAPMDVQSNETYEDPVSDAVHGISIPDDEAGHQRKTMKRELDTPPFEQDSGLYTTEASVLPRTLVASLAQHLLSTSEDWLRDQGSRGGTFSTQCMDAPVIPPSNITTPPEGDTLEHSKTIKASQSSPTDNNTSHISKDSETSPGGRTHVEGAPPVSSFSAPFSVRVKTEPCDPPSEEAANQSAPTMNSQTTRRHSSLSPKVVLKRLDMTGMGVGSLIPLSSLKGAPFGLGSKEHAPGPMETHAGKNCTEECTQQPDMCKCCQDKPQTLTHRKTPDQAVTMGMVLFKPCPKSKKGKAPKNSSMKKKAGTSRSKSSKPDHPWTQKSLSHFVGADNSMANEDKDETAERDDRLQLSPGDTGVILPTSTTSHSAGPKPSKKTEWPSIIELLQQKPAIKAASVVKRDVCRKFDVCRIVKTPKRRKRSYDMEKTRRQQQQPIRVVVEHDSAQHIKMKFINICSCDAVASTSASVVTTNTIGAAPKNKTVRGRAKKKATAAKSEKGVASGSGETAVSPSGPESASIIGPPHIEMVKEQLIAGDLSASPLLTHLNDGSEMSTQERGMSSVETVTVSDGDSSSAPIVLDRT